MTVFNSRLIASFILAILTVLSGSAYAKDCNDKIPTFDVDQTAVWVEQKAIDIFENADKQAIPRAKSVNKFGIHLGELVKPHLKEGSTEGTLTIQTCGKKSLTLKVSDLLSDDVERSAYYLALTKKATFKVLKATGNDKARVAIKRVTALNLVTK